LAIIEADEELEHMPPQNRAHPAMLELRRAIYAGAKRWEVALKRAQYPAPLQSITLSRL